MFRTAREALAGAGHEVRASDLHAARFDPVSSRTSFSTVKDPDYFKPQIEEMHAAQQNGFSAEIEAQIAQHKAGS